MITLKLVIFISFICLSTQMKKQTSLQQKSRLQNLVDINKENGVQSSDFWQMKLYEANGQFFTEIRIGTPPKPFKVVIDTGSGNLILPSIECKTQTCQLHTQYDDSQSESGRIIPNPLDLNDRSQKYQHIQFGTGSIIGKYAQDTICFGDSNQRCLENTQFIVATSMSDDPFLDLQYDGILGLSFLELSVTENFNIMQQFEVQTLMTSFYIDLTLDAFVLSSAYYQEHQLIPMSIDSYQGYWAVEIEEVVVFGIGYLKQQQATAIVDTGSSFISLPQSIYYDLIRIKFNNQDYCEKTYEIFPSIMYKISDQYFELKPEHYIDITSEIITIGNNDEMIMDCTLLIQMQQRQTDALMLGYPFFKAHQTTFNFDKESLIIQNY